MKDTKPNLEDLLTYAPYYAEAVNWLANWSYNESYAVGSAWLEFLDLTGISLDRYGERVNRPGYSPGYLEANYLGKALAEWADRPKDVEAYVSAIMEAEN